MAGEKSKKLGDYGEEIVQKIFPLLGYHSVITNIDIPCFNNEEHKRADAKGNRRTHGIDRLFSYVCPLRDNTIENLVISVKYQDNYPEEQDKITTLFRKHLNELVQTMECLPYSPEYSQRTASNNLFNPDNKRTGVLFWLANDDSIDRGIIESLESFRTTDLNFESVYLVDNKRLNFIFLIFNYIKVSYPKERWEFYYPDTGYNNLLSTKRYSGEILPVQFLNSKIIPIKLESKLLLFINESFSEENVRRMMGLAHNFTRNFSGEVVIHFPHYNQIDHKVIFETVRSDFTAQNFVKNVTIKSFLLNINALGDE